LAGLLDEVGLLSDMLEERDRSQDDLIDALEQAGRAVKI
jgi:hypothetical protein